MFKVKNYPFLEYVDFNGNSIGFAYKYDEDSMVNDPNGFFHYAYFEDQCEEFIRRNAIIHPFLYKKERYGSTTVTNIDLFSHNIRHPSNCRKIHVVKPIKGCYNKGSFICYRNLFSDRYKTIVVGEDMGIDMVSLYCTGTRAYETLLAKINCIKEGDKIRHGRVLFMPNNLLCDCDSKGLYIIKRKETVFNRFNTYKSFTDYINDPNINPENGELFFIKNDNGSKVGYIFMHGEYVKLYV